MTDRLRLPGSNVPTSVAPFRQHRVTVCHRSPKRVPARPCRSRRRRSVGRGVWRTL